MIIFGPGVNHIELNFYSVCDSCCWAWVWKQLYFMKWPSLIQKNRKNMCLRRKNLWYDWLLVLEKPNTPEIKKHLLSWGVRLIPIELPRLKATNRWTNAPGQTRRIILKFLAKKFFAWTIVRKKILQKSRWRGKVLDDAEKMSRSQSYKRNAI